MEWQVIKEKNSLDEMEEPAADRKNRLVFVKILTSLARPIKSPNYMEDEGGYVISHHDGLASAM
jgi:hypothetical protein